MSDNSTNLQLPYLQASQAQKHVTVNDGIGLLDALVMCAIEDKDLTAPPGSPADGSRYIPASGATGAWSTWDFNIAYYVDGAWQKIVPREGFLVYVRDEDVFYVFGGSTWSAFSGGGGTITLTSDVTGSGTSSIATTIAYNAVSNAKFRTSAALSVVGNSTNATANVADIAAGTDGYVLRRSGTALGFGTVATAGIADQAVTYAKIQNVSATSRVLGRVTAGAGTAEELTASQVMDFVGSTRGSLLERGNGGWVAITPGSSGYPLLSNGSGADPAYAQLSLTAGVTGTLPIANGGTGSTTGNVNLADIAFVIDGGGSTITTGMKGYLEIPFDCTINRAMLLADQSGSIVVNIYKCTYSQFDSGTTHPVSGDKITASAPPTISSAKKAQDSTLTGWTTSVSAGDILAFNVDSVTTLQRVTLSLKVTKT